MRGFPLLNLLLAITVSAAVALPLVYRATRVSTTVTGTTVEALPDRKSAGTHALISLRFVHPPQSVRLASNDTTLHEWHVSRPELLLEDSISLPLSDSRSEFTVQIQWPAGTPDTVVLMRVEPDGLPARKADIWSNGNSADEVVTLSWKGDVP